MKKFLLILGLLIAVGVTAFYVHNKNKITLPKPVEHTFKNPIFYRPLRAYATGSWYTFLTPYSITQSPPDEDILKTSDVLAESYSCELVENEYDHVKYDCYVCAKHLSPYCHRYCKNFIITEHSSRGYFIREGNCKDGYKIVLFIRYP